MAAKKKAKKPAPNPWNAHGFAGDSRPFPGAADPIHTQKKGKYLRKKKGC